jgi:hypothetical protein
MHAPTSLSFDIENPLHFDFVVSAAHLRAFTLGIQDSKCYFLHTVKLII